MTSADIESYEKDFSDDDFDIPIKITQIEIQSTEQIDVPLYKECTIKKEIWDDVYVYTVTLNQPYTKDIVQFYSPFEDDERINCCVAMMENGEPVYDSLHMALALQNDVDNNCTKHLKAEMIEFGLIGSKRG